MRKEAPTSYGFDLFLDGEQFYHFNSISINRTINQFVDSFSIQVNNPYSRYSTRIPVGASVSIFKEGVEIFRGMVESKKVTLDHVGSSMTLTGREEFMELVENDADPTLGPFQNLTDNEIINTIVPENNWSWSLGTDKKIKEYSIPSGSTTVAQVLQDIIKYNDFYLIKKGNIVQKKAIPTKNTTSVRGEQRIILSVQNGRLTLAGMRVIKASLDEDIRACKTELVGFSYEQSKSKIQVKNKMQNDDLKSGAYASRLRNSSGLVGGSIDRKRYLTTPAKDTGELNTQIQRTLRDSDIKCSIDITMAGILDIDLLDTIQVIIEQEQVYQHMYVSDVKYDFDQQNKSTTNLILNPFPMI